jgi:hypothetical protein
MSLILRDNVGVIVEMPVAVLLQLMIDVFMDITMRKA